MLSACTEAVIIISIPILTFRLLILYSEGFGGGMKEGHFLPTTKARLRILTNGPMAYRVKMSARSAHYARRFIKYGAAVRPGREERQLNGQGLGSRGGKWKFYEIITYPTQNRPWSTAPNRLRCEFRIATVPRHPPPRPDRPELGGIFAARLYTVETTAPLQTRERKRKYENTR